MELPTRLRDELQRLIVPADRWALVESYPRADETGVLALDVPLWTAEDGRSDLTLSLTARRQANGGWVVQIDDLHVL